MLTAPVDWWRTFFSGVAMESWLKATTAEQTRQEANFLVESLRVAPPARLLDVPVWWRASLPRLDRARLRDDRR